MPDNKTKVTAKQVWNAGSKFFKVIRTTPHAIYGVLRNGNKGRFATKEVKIGRKDLVSNYALA